MSRQAEQRGNGQRVREVGRKIADDHDRLDAQVRDLAAKHRVELPTAPSEEQQAWVDEITGAADADFDRTYVNRSRAAHGSIFGLASQVRAATRDDTMRSFAQTAVDTVMRHMTLLESTGIAETTSLMVVSTGGNDLDGEGGRAKPVRISVDDKKCHRYAICQAEAPEVFQLQGDGQLRYLRKPGSKQVPQVQAAARACPMRAIQLQGTGQ